MSIYRCNGCGYLAETATQLPGTTMACPRCARENKVYDVTVFAGRLIEKYLALRAAHQALQAELEGQEASSGTPVAATPQAPPPAAGALSLDGVDLHNTGLLAEVDQHRAIESWLAAKQIQAHFDHQAIDTSGFFDEVAMAIGEDLEFYRPLLEQIRFAQQRGFTQVNLALDKRSQKDAQAAVAFCRRLYEYSFLAKCFYQKEQRNLRLTLQQAPRIRDFFAGEWLEWFALMQVLKLCQGRGIPVSVARGLEVTFANEDLHELDLIWLLDADRVVCVECKTGEFRPLITKYSGLRKRLGLAKEQLVLCVAGLPQDQANGLTSMYDLTLVNEKGLSAHLESLL